MKVILTIQTMNFKELCFPFSCNGSFATATGPVWPNVWAFVYKKSEVVNSVSRFILTWVGNFCPASHLFSFAVCKNAFASMQQAESTRTEPVFVATAQKFRSY